MKRVGLSHGLLLVLIFIGGSLLAQDWALPLNVVSGDRIDTTTVTIGVDFRATDMFDAALDVAYPIAPPVGMYAYLPISDPEYPGITMLSEDYRSSVESEVEWEITIARDASVDNRIIYWSEEELPFDPDAEDLAWAGEMMIGSAYPGLEVEEWVDMSTITEYEVLAGQVVYIDVTMAGSVDEMGPEVTYNWPPDGAEGISRVTPIEVHIQDDITGVDPESIVLMIGDEVIDHEDFMSFDPILLGWSFTYRPEGDWDELATICAKVFASDLADPVHLMADTFEFCFTTPSEPPDTLPPYFEVVSPMDGDTNVYIHSCVRLQIRDSGRGVDMESIVVNVDGVEIEEYTITAIAGFSDDYALEICPPEGGWLERHWYTINVDACDRADPANCEEFEMVFQTGSEIPVSWAYAFRAWTFSDGEDTTWTSLSIATDPDASEFYDAGFDIPSPSPPFATFHYFPVMDPSHPSVTMLQRDVQMAAHTVQWEVMVNAPEDICGISWDREALIELLGTVEGSFRIGHGPELDDIDWVDMELYSNVVYDPSEFVFIRFTDIAVDNVGPTIWAPNPGFGAEDIAISSNICFDLLDPESGVNAATIRMFFGPTEGMITEVFDYSITPLSTGYRICYDPATLLSYNTLYTVRVQADDNHVPANSGGGEWTFRTTNTDAPTFELGISVCDIEDVDTTCGTLIIGTEPDALVGRDDYDVPVPVLPPSGFVPYFPIEDPIYDYLTKDVRPTAAGPQMWEIKLARNMGTGLVSWTMEDVLVDPDWMLGIAVAAVDVVPTDDDFRENNMAEISSIEYTGGERAWIKILDTDPHGPGTSCIAGEVVLYGDDEVTTADIAVNPVGATATTGEGGGTFEICGLPNDDYYTVIVSAEGYVTETLYVELDSVDSDLGEIELRPPGVWVHGVVTIEGEAAPAITVTLGGDAALTDGDGEYEFDDVMPGTYIIEFSGFPIGYPATSWEVTIPEGVDEYVIDFDYEQPPLTISGTVTLSGEVAEGVEIYDCEGGLLATTNEAGYYEIDSLTPDNYCLEAVADGYESELIWVYVVDDTTIDFNLYRGTIDISGTISTECGDPVFGTEVTITGTSEPVVTSASGTFEFRDLDWGDYTIEAALEYHAVIETTVTAEGDMVVDIVLPCLECVTDFAVDAYVQERPIPSGEIAANYISWTAPVTSLTIDHYDLYINGTPVTPSIAADAVDHYDEDILSGVDYEYHLVVVYAVDGIYTESRDCASETVTPSITADPNQILIIDYDGGDTPVGGVGVEQSIEDILDSPTFGFTGGYTTTDQDPMALDGYEFTDYDMIILCMGEEETGAIDDGILEDLIVYMNTPWKTIYVEGPDFGENYGAVAGVARNFYQEFGINWAAGHDNSPVDSVVSNEDVFGIYFKGTYPGGTDVDDLLLNEASAALYSQDGLVRASYRVVDANKKRIASTIYVGALEGRDGYAMDERVLGQYLLEAGLDNTSITEIPTDVLPTSYEIGRVFPNPFNPVTSVEFDVPEAANVQIAVYDANGRMVQMLYTGTIDAGVYSTTFNGAGLPSGTYYARMIANGIEASAKMILLK